MSLSCRFNNVLVQWSLAAGSGTSYRGVCAELTAGACARSRWQGRAEACARSVLRRASGAGGRGVRAEICGGSLGRSVVQQGIAGFQQLEDDHRASGHGCSVANRQQCGVKLEQRTWCRGGLVLLFSRDASLSGFQRLGQIDGDGARWGGFSA
ncbi:hypothetical protein J5N97_022528 [Dioscorea zingiberensis]|uniref:Uncharacterized protein n=1 Tax=Dioscorea zingiberensis TaxID=325984 RepID=A0A9D5CA96_9LILI|nr:hypothetical protein J5N97_022528 [Dioscorea zingiberensis]